MARPQKNNKQNQFITVYLTQAEKVAILKKAATVGISGSEYLRKIGLKRTIKPRFSSDELKYFQGLIGIGNNLHQVAQVFHAKAFHAGAMGNIESDLKACINVILAAKDFFND